MVNTQGGTAHAFHLRIIDFNIANSSSNEVPRNVIKVFAPRHEEINYASYLSFNSLLLRDKRPILKKF